MTRQTPNPPPHKMPRTAHAAKMTVWLVGLWLSSSACSLLFPPPQEVCTPLAEVCPDLQCDEYQKNEDGCSMCVCADGPDPVGCRGNEDCGPDEYCDLTGAEPTAGSADEPAVGLCRAAACAGTPARCADDEVMVCSAPAEGEACPQCTCVPTEPPPPPPPVSCTQDDECGPSQRCQEVTQCPPCVDEEPACGAPCTIEGQCVDIDPGPSCALIDCQPNYTCIDTEDGGVCVPVQGGMCDDDSTAVCERVPPTCEDGLILAIQNGCFACVDPNTCEPPPTISCANVDCLPGFTCEDTIDGPRCVEDGYCGDGSEAICLTLVEPSCPEGEVIVVRDGCYHCADAAICGTPDCAAMLCGPDTRCVETPEGGVCVPDVGSCDDGDEVLCDALPPTCEDGLILAIQNGCFACVDPNTCEPPPTISCANVDCLPGFTCEDTIDGPRCVEDGYCGDGSEAICLTLVEPSCPEGEVIVVRDGCYHCADAAICGTPDCAAMLCGPDTRCVETPAGGVCVPDVGSCDDGDEVLCDALPPTCEDGLIAAAQNGCYACVDPLTCRPPGAITCANVDCFPGFTCEESPTGPKCIEDGYCGDGSEAICLTLDEPSCPEGQVVVVRDGCYHCADAAICAMPSCAVVRCAAGYQCVDTDQGGQCELYEAGCYSDAECRFGTVCNAADVCLPPPECSETNMSCPGVCYGACVPPSQP